MKNRLIQKTILISSLAFFSACSHNNTPDIKKKSLSAYNIMGIEKSTNSSPLFIIEEQPSQNEYNFIVKNTKSYQPIVQKPTYNAPESSHIEIISYGRYQPLQERSFNHKTKKLKNEIESNAKSFLGTKYVWGATGPRKFDCSGFTQWVYRDAGIKIPRVSRDQAKVGDYVRYTNLKRGDMVFFDTKKRRTGKVSHVGIYLGSGNFIHASSGAKKVVIYNFDAKPFYKKRFLWGRRVINESGHLASK